MMGRCVAVLFVAACSGGEGNDDVGGGSTGNPHPDELVLYGQPFTGGQFHLGPVDYEESQWHNACAPSTKYAPAIRDLEGPYLAGLWSGIPDVASLCDACIYVTTDQGKSALLRVVTYGDTTPNSIDVSPAAFAILDSGEFPRTMTWQLARCNDTGAIRYEFQTEANAFWTSLWVRNARVPIARIAVTSPNHASPVELARAGDGTVTDASGFGEGTFTLEIDGIDGQHVTDTFSWPAGGVAGQTLAGAGNLE